MIKMKEMLILNDVSSYRSTSYMLRCKVDAVYIIKKMQEGIMNTIFKHSFKGISALGDILDTDQHLLDACLNIIYQDI